MKLIEVPGQGVVEFPDTMSDDQIAAAIKANMPAEAPASPAAPQMTRAEFLKRELLRSPPVALARGVKDVIDTGAEGLAWLYDKATGGGSSLSGLVTGQQGEAGRVRAMNQAGRAEFDAATQGEFLPQAARLGGNLAVTAPAVGALGGAVAKVAPRLGAAIGSSGLTTGAAPVGLAAKAADMGIRMTGGAVGGGLAAGMVDPEDAKVGAGIGAAVPVVGKVLQVGAGAARQALGATTGVGSEAIGQAFKAGQKGGKAAETFAANMRGDAQMDDVLSMAKANLDTMRQSRQAAYRSGMVDVSKDKTVLSLDGIRKAATEAADSLSFQGVAKDPKAAKAVTEARKEIQKWAIKPPEQFHTPEGLDALKQRIGALIEAVPMEQRNARRALQGIYDSVKREITKQAPGYAKVMEDYSKATATLSEVEKSLIGGQKATADTAMRKLQSLMRNNVNTSYGYRDRLAQTMIEQGGQDFMPALAGQALGDWVPRGIQRATGGGGAAALAALGQIPAAAGMAAVSSPRLIGEGAFLLGRGVDPLAGLLGRVAPLGAGLLPNERP